ncbi:DNA replication/repair protein RecF [Ancylobacter amanitiformis]|uniref:DNA replication and repair protein RecF n=1 Tax=Ancylobacter amanitiformis TaxID=217069 RepID=A0ABU0LSQ3_9HYPH|nr:DNA replication/repair protein RecF [Ancylobacter amanitiformis]MDQ0511680.1 DNA replication and repair protein RecF [Ancylobacter amanitiformis]
MSPSPTSSLAASRARVIRLRLTDFRSYHGAEVRAGDGPIVLVGPNGAGKTNLLEAISLLAPGRGLRRAGLDQFAARLPDGTQARGWAVAATVEGAYGEVALGTGIEADGTEARTRRCRVDGEPVGSAAAFADHVRVVWLTPEMDGLFTGPPSDRRRFLDRLVLAVDAEHGARVNALERALRSRNRLLEEMSTDPRYLDAVEQELAALAVAVAAARLETVRRLAAGIAQGRERARDDVSPFPFATVALEGEVERALAREPATIVEDQYRDSLRAGRPRDRAAGRTLTGPHLTDFLVGHGPKAIPAAQGSTGEQKALLIGLALAHARLVGEMAGMAPVMLLDDVVAYLDPVRRAALFAALDALGSQVWMTGADPSAFAALGGRAERFNVTPGRIVPAEGE